MKILKTLSKRGLALFLVLTMCVSLLPTTALAAEWTENHPDAGTYCGVPAHTHTDECYANTLVCVLDEFQEHLHGDGCYTVVQEQTCGLYEAEDEWVRLDAGTMAASCENPYDLDHVHSAYCFLPLVVELSCEAFDPEHIHNPSCFVQLVEGHRHDASCYEEVKVLTCAMAETEGHTHDDSCYENVLVCGLAEHVHSEACYVNPEAAEEVPAEVQAFLSTVEELRGLVSVNGDSVTIPAENYDAVGELIQSMDGDVLDSMEDSDYDTYVFVMQVVMAWMGGVAPLDYGTEYSIKGDAADDGWWYWNGTSNLNDWIANNPNTDLTIWVDDFAHLNGTLLIPSSKIVTIQGQGKTIYRGIDGGFGGVMFRVEGTLNLYNVTVEGRNKDSGEPGVGYSMIEVNGGRLTLGDGATLKENRIQDSGHSENGGAVRITNGGELTMAGNATIQNCYTVGAGGAIAVESGKFVNNTTGSVHSYGSNQYNCTVYVAAGAECTSDEQISGWGDAYTTPVYRESGNQSNQNAKVTLDADVYVAVMKNPTNWKLPSEPTVVTGPEFWFIANTNYAWYDGTPAYQGGNARDVLKDDVLTVATQDVHDWFKDGNDWKETRVRAIIPGSNGSAELRDMTKIAPDTWETILWNIANDDGIAEKTVAVDGKRITRDNYKDYTIIPYVIKFQSGPNGAYDKSGVSYGWHIDCAIVPNDYRQLTYNVNLPDGMTWPKDGKMPDTVTLGSGMYDATVGDDPNPSTLGDQEYTFIGWSRNKDATVAEYRQGGNVHFETNERTITLFAVWQKVGKTHDISYTVEYYKDGETAPFYTTEPITETVDSDVNTLTVTSVEDRTPGGYKLDRYEPTLPATVRDGDVIKVYYVKDDDPFDSRKVCVVLNLGIGVASGLGILGEPTKVTDLSKYWWVKSDGGLDKEGDYPNWINYSNNANNIIKPEIVSDPQSSTSNYTVSGQPHTATGLYDPTGAFADKYLSGINWKQILKDNWSQISQEKGLDASAKAEDYEIVPYVAKFQTDDHRWHIDCAVLPTQRTQLNYVPNLPGGLAVSSDSFTCPPGELSAGEINTSVEKLKFDGTEVEVDKKILTKRDNTDVYLIFLGWSTTPTGKVEYEPGDAITVDAGRTKILYGVWREEGVPYDISYTVEYYQDGVKFDTVSVTKTVESDVTTLTVDSVPDKTPSGYVLDTEKSTGLPVVVRNGGVIKVYYVAPKLSIEKTANQQEVKVGETITYTITVENTGSAAASNVVITDILDNEYLEFVSATLNDVEVENYTGNVKVPTLEIGDTAEVVIVAKTIKAGTVTNQARVKGDNVPEEPSNKVETEVKALYTVEYYYDGEIDNSKTETGSALLGSQITEYTDKPISNYRLDKIENLPLTISGNTSENVIRVYYVAIQMPPTIPTPGNPSTPNYPSNPGTTISDNNVPLAAPGLNSTDHFDYIKGYSDDTVRPEANITRAEVATIFFRLMTNDFRTANWATENDFSDVKSSDWYNNAISTCVKAGILKGYPDGTFRPNQSITRAEFAAIAASFASEAVPSGGMFKDIEGHWAQESIERAAAAGWIKGSNGMFRPNDKITRAEVITTINRMLDRVPDADHLLADMKTFSDNTPDKWYYADVQEATNSHDYERAEDGVTGIWIELLPEQDWTALEKEWATAADANVVDVASNLMVEGENAEDDTTGEGESSEDDTTGDGDDK